MPQNLLAFDPKAIRVIVADPDFKKIPEYEDGVRAAPLHVVFPSLENGWFRWLKVQIGNEIDNPPRRRGDDLG